MSWHGDLYYVNKYIVLLQNVIYLPREVARGAYLYIWLFLLLKNSKYQCKLSSEYNLRKVSEPTAHLIGFMFAICT